MLKFIGWVLFWTLLIIVQETLKDRTAKRRRQDLDDGKRTAGNCTSPRMGFRYDRNDYLRRKRDEGPQ